MSGQLHPALRPANIHGLLKQKYARKAQLRSLFREVEEPTDNYTDLLEVDPTGEIGELSGDAGFKEVKVNFKDTSARINLFGAFFKVTKMDEDFSKVSVVQAGVRAIDSKMKIYYENKVLNALYNISGHNTYSGSQWSVIADGTPLKDFEGAIGESVGASGIQPDIAIMNTTTFLVLLGYPQYSQYQYIGKENIMRSGIADRITPNGLRLVVLPDAVASTYIPDNKIYVTKEKMCGANHWVKGYGFTTDMKENPDNPLVKKYFGWEAAAPSIDEIDAAVTTVITVT